MRIAISPDQNPGEPGVVAANGTEEATLNAAVASALQTALQRCGQDAWFDPSSTREDRVAKANGDGTALLVTCSHNVSTPGLSGTQFVFCPGGQTFGSQGPAADAVYAELAKIAGWPARREDEVADVYECCAFERDTVFVRYLFMSPDDEALWARQDYSAEAAEATARGLAAVYGFEYSVPPPPPRVWRPIRTDNAAHWWGPYVTGADQVVELLSSCRAPVWKPNTGHWYQDTTIIGTPAAGEYAEWTLANRIDGIWYVMDESGGPGGQGPIGRLPVEQAYWIEDAVTDSTGCGGSDPPGVAEAGGGHWWSIGGVTGDS
jgi:hypothetical protein